MALAASLMVMNCTKANPRDRLKLRSEGMKESMIWPARQNMDSSSVLAIFFGRLETNKETKLSLIFCKWEGRGPFPRSTRFMRKNLLLKNKKKKVVVQSYVWKLFRDDWADNHTAILFQRFCGWMMTFLTIVNPWHLFNFILEDILNRSSYH